MSRACVGVLALALSACDMSAAVLVQHGREDGGITDADIGDADDASEDGNIVVDAGPDADVTPDAGVTAAVRVYGTGFEAFAGETVYARLGPFSFNVVSGTIAPDGTFVLDFPPVTFAVFDNIYFDLYVDENGDGDCQWAQEETGGRNVTLHETGPGTYETTIDRDELVPPIPFTCNGL